VFQEVGAVRFSVSNDSLSVHLLQDRAVHLVMALQPSAAAYARRTNTGKFMAYLLR
jgi:hypothetical protein